MLNNVPLALGVVPRANDALVRDACLVVQLVIVGIQGQWACMARCLGSY